LAIQKAVVAIVEDDPSFRRSVARLLNAYGFDTETYPSAEMFLAGDVTQAACLVLDIHLGGMSGIALAGHMGSAHPEIPIIIITAIDDDGAEAEVRRIGCIAFLRKPFSGESLIGAVSRAFAVGSF